MIRKFVLVSVLFFAVNLSSTQDKKSKDCGSKDQGKCFNEKNKKIGCCKLKYPGGGYDYVKATEEECKRDESFHVFLGYNNSLCMEWEEK